MKQLLMAVLVGLVISGSAWAKDKNGEYITKAVPTCGEYLDAYGKTTLNTEGYSGPHEAFKVFGWMNGYITAYNRQTPNGLSGVLGTMPLNDARRWMASWCRDNPASDLDDALYALFSALQ